MTVIEGFTTVDRDGVMIGSGRAVIGVDAVPFVVHTIGNKFTLSVYTTARHPVLVPIPITCGFYRPVCEHPEHYLMALAEMIIGDDPERVAKVHHDGFPWIEAGDWFDDGLDDDDDDLPDDVPDDSRLIYADEMTPGAVVWWEPTDGRTVIDVTPGWATVLRVRDSSASHGPLAAVLDLNGTQVPGYYSPVELVRTRIDTPGVNRLDEAPPRPR